jgi:hypothetical protein
MLQPILSRSFRLPVQLPLPLLGWLARKGNSRHDDVRLLL